MAILCSHTLTVLAGLSHPNGILSLAGLAFLHAYLDRHRLKLRHVALAAIPYLIGGIGWGIYILKDPGVFISQFSSNFKLFDRFTVSSNPFDTILAEIKMRYWPVFGFYGSFPMNLRRCLPYIYLAAIVMGLATRSIRQLRVFKILMPMTVLYFALMIFLRKADYYLIHIIPFYTALLAIAIVWLWRQNWTPRWAIVLGFVGLLGLQVGHTAGQIKWNTYRHGYLPTVEFLKRNARPDQLIVGSGELAFNLGFHRQLIDDARLGYLSGKKPDFIVLEYQYRDYWIPMFRWREPETLDYMLNLLATEYRLVFHQAPTRGWFSLKGAPYQVYARISQTAEATVRTSMEFKTNRPGDDYLEIVMAEPSPELCAEECVKDSRCKAYTYVTPGIQGRDARCWLKSKPPLSVPDPCCTSGVKLRGAAAPDSGGM
jgi:hypothetical protein